MKGTVCRSRIVQRLVALYARPPSHVVGKQHSLMGVSRLRLELIRHHPVATVTVQIRWVCELGGSYEFQYFECSLALFLD